MKHILILALLLTAPFAWATTCNITASGPIQADDTLGAIERIM